MSTLIRKDGVLPSFTRAYRLFIWIGSVRYYANRSEETPTTGLVRWLTKDQEYPDHFTRYQAARIREFYIDQNIKVEEVILQDEDV